MSLRRAAEQQRDDEPVRIAIDQAPPLLGNAQRLAPLFGAVGTFGLTLLLAIFMLINREELRNRLVSLSGRPSLAVATKAFADAGDRISRYLLMQFIVNATMGLAVGIGLYFIGVPYAALWGLTAGLLRYLPYVGPWIAALLPITVSLVTVPGWQQVALVVGLVRRARALEQQRHGAAALRSQRRLVVVRRNRRRHFLDLALGGGRSRDRDTDHRVSRRAVELRARARRDRPPARRAARAHAARDALSAIARA